MHSRSEIGRNGPPAGLLARRALASDAGVVIPLARPRLLALAPRRVLPDFEAAFLSPAAVFGSPDDVVRHPLLSLDAKREILRRWASDEELIEIAQGEGMPEGPPSRLGEVRNALLRLADERPPHPAAPAAFAFAYEIDERLALAA
jgi:hypothetical protein